MSLEMRLRFIALSTFLLIGRGAAAQLATSPEANPIGTWRGTSHCVARAAGCKDELIVYRIARRGRDSLSVDTRRVVDGQEAATAMLACELNAPRAYITCAAANGKWRLRVRHDSLMGQLRLPDGTWSLDVHAVRASEPRRPDTEFLQ
jgi:hypothetical protein